MKASGRPSAPITLMGYPGDRRPAILGTMYLMADNVVLSGLLFDGPTGPGSANPSPKNPTAEGILVWLEGRNLELNASEVSGGRSQGIFATEAENARITGNYIHDNGDFTNPAVANLDHGIYFASGSGLVANNLFEHNYAFGVHLYPSPHDVLVAHNTIVDHGRAGVIIAGEPGKTPPAGNRVVNNIVAGNAMKGVVRYGPVGRGNIVQRNLSWDNGAGGSATGLELVNNFEADPLFAGPSDYHLLDTSPALDAGETTCSLGIDHDGSARPLGDAPDIGAFEGPKAAPLRYPPPTIAARQGSRARPRCLARSFGLWSARSRPRCRGSVGFPPAPCS
jgi:Right handed beta helix region